MKRYFFILTIIALACNSPKKNEDQIKESAIVTQDVSYFIDSLQMIGYMAYNSAITGKRPVVMVVHEWWGLNDYAKYRVIELAKLGYLAFAVDIYGNRTQGNDPDAAGKLAGPFYKNPVISQERFAAGLKKALSFSEADTTQVAAIGYCFGGAQVINYAKQGMSLKGVVSFHGNLNVLPADKNLLKAKILVYHGNDDKFVSQAEVDQFKKQMDSIGANYKFVGYDSVTHAFSNPKATETGKKFNLPITYNAAADTASWKDMQVFFKEIFLR